MSRIGLMSALLLMSCVASAGRLYQAPLGDETWRAKGNPLRCGLSLRVPNYGTAYFEQYAAKAPHFIMSKWQQIPHAIHAKVYAKPPQWRPGLRLNYITSTDIRPGKYGIFLSRNNSLKVLNTLAAGFKTRFKYRSDLGDWVRVDLSPVHFQSSYARYMRCVGELLPFDFAMIRHSTLHFDKGAYRLSDDARAQLEKIRRYVVVDKQVRQVYIAGFSDSLGRNGFNNAISQMRAEAAKRYLLRRGVPKRLINITWFGQKKPMASNKTAQGRAQNRRVIINLYK